MFVREIHDTCEREIHVRKKREKRRKINIDKMY